MSKVTEVTPMEIKFDNQKEEESFIKWFNDKNTVDQPKMIEMRKKIKRAREIKKRVSDNWLKNY
jgi:hypothetical protein